MVAENIHRDDVRYKPNTATWHHARMTDTTNEITLRSPNAHELRAWVQPLLIAFAEEASEAELEAEVPMLEPERLINAFDGERRIGSAGAFSLRLTVPGGDVGASGITAVGVLPEYRRRGVLRQMMTWLLDDAKTRGEPVAVLWASEAAIYQRFGFGNGTLQSGFEVDRSRFVFGSPLPPSDRVRIRMVDVDEGVRLAPPIYDAVRRHVPGSLARSEIKWRNFQMGDAEWMRRGNGPRYRAVLEVDGEPRGYVVYQIKGEWDGRGPRNTLLVTDLVGLDPETEQRLWQWVSSMDLVATLRLMRGPVPNPLQLWLQEPRRLGLTVADGMWLRFVDVAAALAARTYAGEGSVVLELEDALIDSNAGRWQLTVRADGAATMERTTAEPDLALDVASLACTYLGAFRFRDLAAAGRVREIQPGALHTADVLFTTSRAPFSNTMF